MERERPSNFTAEMLLTPEYRRTLIHTHRANKGWGAGGKYHAETVLEFARLLKAKSILDYGCGQGVLKLRLDDIIPVAQYDPGIPKYSELPQPADLVVCTDVLEHVEPDRLLYTLAHLRSLARMGMFAIIATTKANLVLTDGRNAHLSLYMREVWRKQLINAGFKITKEETPKGFWVWCI